MNSISFAGYWLCQTPGTSIRVETPAALFEKDGDDEEQITSGPDWQYKKGFARGNEWARISFQCQKVFSTIPEAEAYILGYQAAGHHPKKGSLRIVLDGPSPTDSWLHDALISVPRFTHSGCRVFASYSAQGPRFTAPATQTFYSFAAAGDSLIPTNERSPAAGQGWEISGSSLIPRTSVTTDPHWVINGGNTSIIPTGA